MIILVGTGHFCCNKRELKTYSRLEVLTNFVVVKTGVVLNNRFF